MKYRRSPPSQALVVVAALSAIAVTPPADAATVLSAERKDESACSDRRDCDAKGRAPSRGKRKEPPGADATSRSSPGPPAERELKDGNPDPFRQLGAGSPFCRRAGVRSRAGCRIAGSVSHTYPASNYGLDIQIETRIDKVENNLFAALQSVAALFWLGLVYALKGVLLLLEWAFSLDLLNAAMRGVRRALERLHEEVLGRSWFMAALSVAGLWGIWRGLVQRRTIQTLAGLAATVALMVLALVLIANPTGTVGHASRLANEGSLGFMALASGKGERPAESFADASRRLFDALAVRPWCALQFGDVDWCMRRRRGGHRMADLWLAFPAEGKEREALYKLTKGEELDDGGFFADLKDSLGSVIKHGPGALPGTLLALADGARGDGDLPDSVKRSVARDPGKVAMQEKGGTFTRLALLLMVALGLAGALCLLLYLAIKLVLAGLLSLVLLLLAPAMLLAPAFGESGRMTFLAWLKRLAGALAAKLIYALLLAVVVVAATALAALQIGWFGTWLLQSAFWWGILVKRRELTGFLSVSPEGEKSGAGRFARLYHDARAVRSAGKEAAGVATAVPARGARAVAAERLLGSEAKGAGAHAAARSELDKRAERARGLELDQARAVLARRPGLQEERYALTRALRPYQQDVVEARARGLAPREPHEDEQRLLAERDRIDRALASDELRRAEATVREADRAHARDGRLTGEAERVAWREQRRRDIREGLPLDHERNLRAAGIDPREYRARPAEVKAELRQRVSEAIERDHRLLAAVPERGERAPTSREARQAMTAIPPEELRTRTREQRAALRHERGIRRRQHLYRR